MTSPETSYIKDAVNEHSLTSVTHMTRFDIRFGRYGALKICFNSGQVMNRLDCRRLVRFLGHKMGETR
jgi:hypothetical protein